MTHTLLPYAREQAREILDELQDGEVVPLSNNEICLAAVFEEWDRLWHEMRSVLRGEDVPQTNLGLGVWALGIVQRALGDEE